MGLGFAVVLVVIGGVGDGEHVSAFGKHGR